MAACSDDFWYWRNFAARGGHSCVGDETSCPGEERKGKISVPAGLSTGFLKEYSSVMVEYDNNDLVLKLYIKYTS